MAAAFRRNDKPWPYVTILVGLWCILVFLGVNLQSKGGIPAYHRWGWVTDYSIFNGDYWGLITTAFVHQEFLHIAFNLYWLWLLGAVFERNLGSLWLAVFILVTAFISSGVQFASGEPGIGLSGVGYALIGFCWFTRSIYPDFYRVANDRIVRMFIIWFVFCVVTTYTGILQVANFAHLGGLIAGIVAGAFLSRPKLRVPLGVAGLALVAISIVPLFYNPLSGPWNLIQGDKAFNAGNDPAAIQYYQTSLKVVRSDINPSYVWQQLARIYAREGNPGAYRDAVSHIPSNP